MKKCIVEIIIFVLSLSLVACSGTVNDKNEIANKSVYSEEYMGIWYGYGTDGDEAQFKFEFIPIDTTRVYVKRSGWGTNSNLEEDTVIITFISETIAETPLEDAIKQKYVFNVNGEQTIVMDYVNASGTPIAEPTYMYRNSTR